MLHDNGRQFAHERLAIALSFACDDKVGIGNDVVEIKQF